MGTRKNKNAKIAHCWCEKMAHLLSANLYMSEYMEVFRHVVVNNMSCWIIAERVYSVITLILNSSFHKLFNCTTFHPSRASSGIKMIYTKKTLVIG